ncbi:SusD/RagB family nutrient-binding outer membrane lipoprotein [Runella slithyformis]|uniref:SusD/RagB family nutrient-binding outer membrane lipoprotein n=1 Tax=Runella slithyformis (strain ATCC 29530 / DSM 19594 / LMG 11500 / NCIMB 11436 / LSU 4) TaxID=761193 RepID=A0A7U3ZQY4_RUNSL|nr:SusD/RagB family nutrient-binding outer membrane lipoprotein [Runella slithyformis]AEI51745.1 hypothetical protein Runsl_5454 [Runella slithyformis DSM 19594]
MKIKYLILTACLALTFESCETADFEAAYTDPSKIANSTVEKQFSGFLQTNRDFVLPAYRNYFVVLRITLNRYTQSIGWVNGENQYVPGSSAIEDKWKNYYQLLTQYRELEKIYASLGEADKADRKIYMLAATTYLYDHTQVMVDLHGDIPFSEAARLSQNGGDYSASYPKYDKAEDLYRKMLDDLKQYADELSTITVSNGIQAGFRTQDFLLKGDLTAWRRYVNSLRLRMLTRVSGTASLGARAKTEMAEIVGNPTKFPIVTSNAQNIQMTVFDLNSPINSRGFQSGFEDWNGNLASNVIINHMKTNRDPRLRFVFEPGTAAAGEYNGLDNTLNAAVQTEQIASNRLAIYNRSTLSRNQFFPGMLISASEVSLYLAEYYLSIGNDALARTNYENSIRQSIDFYTRVRDISNDNTTPKGAAVLPAEIDAYLASEGVNWANAKDKLLMIASQKWLHFNVVQPYQNWAEMRRLDAPTFRFWEDASNPQRTPPVRWFYADEEKNFNAPNYELVRSRDNLTTRIFWDLK